MIWEELTSYELGQVDKRTPVVLPIAAIEQHGPHLPLATDRIIGEYFCGQLSEQLPDKVLVLPAISVGCSEHHLDFPGSLSITHETMLNHITDIFNAVKLHGFTNFLLFNSHGGNLGIGQVFVEKFGHRNQDVNIHMISWWKVVADKLSQVVEGGFGSTGHAGEFETSLMMLIRPDLVRTDKIEEGYPNPTADWAKQDMLQAPKVGHFKTFKELTKKGTFGNPTLASVEKGEQISKIVIHQCLAVIKDIYSS